MPDRGAQTEQPTQRRLEKARKDGQFPQAKEFVGAIQFLAVVTLLAVGAPAWMAGFRATARQLFRLAFARDLTPADLVNAAWAIVTGNLLPLVAAGLLLVLTTLAFRLGTTRFGFSFNKLAPDLKRLDPMAKLTGLPRQNLPQAAQAAILLPLFLWAAYAVATEKLDRILVLPLGTVQAGWQFLASSLMELFWKAAGLFVVFGSVDLFRQIRRHNRDLRMTKQEIKEEMKEMEGNPQMKARIRRIQRDNARRQMMKEVPMATAVVVNPTHFAVAIRYDMESMAAPRVVAKGKNYLALRIREKALAHGVPLIENPPLARALYKAVDVGQEIPPHLYRAVAEILAYIFKLMNGRLPG